MSDTRAPQTSEAPQASPGEPSERTHPSGPLDGTATVGHVSNVPTKAPPPKVIAHYELREKLGEGGMGAVYKGWHPKMQRFGAVKLLPAELMQNPSLVTRFEHEIALVAKLNHPHVVLTHDAGEEGGLHYLVLEYLEGTDLSKLVKQRGPLSLENALMAIRQAALGLQHAHERGLVHRDIKPANLMLHRSGKAQAVVKVMDFGLALLTDGNSLTELTKSGQIMGTPEYMAPEQWESTHEVDARADLYSLGATLHFLLIGRSPYRRSESTTVLHLMKSHALDPIPDLTALRPGIPPEVNALFQRLMAKSRDDRPASALEVVREIDAIQRSARGSRANASGEPEAVRPRTTPEPNPVRGLTPPGSPSAERVGDIEPPQTLSDLFDAIAADQRTVTLPSVAARGSRADQTSADAREPRAPQRRWLIAAALAAVVVLAGIIIKIKDGSVTENKVPDDATVEVTDEKSKMAAPGRPAVPNKEGKTAGGGHPTGAREPRAPQADWPEWAKELREPPPLEEWLKGRKVLTVQQDGSAMFQTIQAALDKVQPGEVIRVLDKGPYRERLVSVNHPGNFGLVSDVNTVIELGKWELNPTARNSWFGHSFSAKEFRISGLTFVCTMPEADGAPNRAELSTIPIQFFAVSGLRFEDCVVLAAQADDDPQSNLSTKSAAHFFALNGLCLRRNVFGASARIGL